MQAENCLWSRRLDRDYYIWDSTVPNKNFNMIFMHKHNSLKKEMAYSFDHIAKVEADSHTLYRRSIWTAINKRQKILYTERTILENMLQRHDKH